MGSRGLMVVLCGVFSVACHAESDPMLSPADAEAFLAVAGEMSADSMAGALGLAASQQEAFAARLGTLHESMRDVHERIPSNASVMSREEQETLHASLEPAMVRVHAAHDALMDVLTEEQRADWMAHVKTRMAAHHEAMGFGASAHPLHRPHGEGHADGAGAAHR